MELENITEALIFASPDGISTKEIARLISSAGAKARERAKHSETEEPNGEFLVKFIETSEDDVYGAIENLNRLYQEQGRAFALVERPAGWRIATRVEFAVWVKEMFPDKKPTRLSPSALETLAIIAYRQPLTKSSMEAVRGVSVDGPLQTLLDRNIIRIAGRADLPGRPLLYETTELFFEHFGINSVEELPNAAELRAVKLPEPAPPAAPSAEQQELPLESDVSDSDPKKKGRKKHKAQAVEQAEEKMESPMEEAAAE